MLDNKGAGAGGSSRELRVVHYLRRVRTEDGGVVRFVLDLAALTAGVGHRVSLVTFDPTGCPPEWLDPQPGGATPKVHRLGHLARGQAHRSLRRILRDADVVHIHSLWGVDDAYVALAAQHLGLPYVVSLHGVLDSWSLAQRRCKKRAHLLTIGKPVLQRAAFVHCTADEELRQARLSAAIRRPAVIPCALDLSPFIHARSSRPTGQPSGGGEPNRVLFLSRLHPKKGVHHLLEAVAKLKERGMNVTLDIAGDGDGDYPADLLRQVETLGLRDQTTFLGHIVEPERSNLLARSDVMVLPTAQENFGLALIEALAAGTPVVTTTGVDVYRELLRTGAAYVVDVHQPSEAFVDALADAIAAALVDHQTNKRLILEAQQEVERWLDPSRVAAAYVDMYASAIDQHNHERPLT